MARCDGMALSLDVSQYLRLPGVVRARLDVWLRRENIADKRVVSFVLGEGLVTVEQEALDGNGKAFLNADGEIATQTAVYPVRTLPPREVFDHKTPEIS